ncbi:gliding motility-associated C-terminal domain-containing protein [bacterium]|nr:gliding motility-associated C-terminal domain-containing protein [bacterium]
MKRILTILFFISTILTESTSAQISGEMPNSDEKSLLIIRQNHADADPMQKMTVSDTYFDFEEVPIKTSRNDTFTLYNTGSDTPIILDIRNRNSAFFIDGKTDFIHENTSRDMTITFYPKEAGSYVDTLRIFSYDQDGPVLEVILTGSGIDPTQDELPVSVFPNPFTPNGDGFNDYVEFIFSENGIQKPVVQIFNLRGEKICELDGYTGNGYQWNGQDSDGNDAEPGVYIYIFTPKDNQASNGTITLIR